MAGKLTLQGWVYHVLDKQTHSFEPDSGSTSSRTIDKIESVFSLIENKPDLVSVVLSNHFVRYAIIEADHSLKNKAEENAYIKHRFGQLFGESESPWEFRFDQKHPSSPFLVSAVEAKLTASLREICKRFNVKLRSIQPCLMKIYNLSKTELMNKDAWLILCEQGKLCIVWLKDGYPDSVRMIKAGEDWQEKLAEIVEREIYLSELETSNEEIYLWSTDHKKIMMSKDGRWKIQIIRPEPLAGLSGQYDEQYTLAMCG
jgi:hypothetical protein